MRRFISIGVLVMVASLFIGGCSVAPVDATCQTVALSESRIREIAIGEFRRRGGVFAENSWDIRVIREHCRNVFFASQRPAAPGRFFGVTIDDFGNVIEYSPGV